MGEKQDTKVKILNAAMDMFLRYGYHGTSMASIAAEAEVGKGTLYWHFKSKKELFTETIRAENQKSIQKIHSIVKSKKTAEEKLMSFIRYSIKNMIENKEETQMFLNNEYYLDHTFKETLLKCLFEVIKEVDVIIKEGKEQGVFFKDENDPDLEKTAVAILGAVNFMGSLLLREKEIELDSTTEFIYNFIINGIGAK